jgi:ribosome maturation factor RimP
VYFLYCVGECPRFILSGSLSPEGGLLRREELADLVQPLLDQEGFELVECSVSRHLRNHVFRLSVDRDQGVSVEACSRLSREISNLLDTRPLLRGAFQLEVSSAGMDRPVWTEAHYRRFEGEEVHILLAGTGPGNRALRGAIGPMESGGVWIIPAKGEKRLVRWEEIEKAHLHMDPWKKRMREAPSPAEAPEEGAASKGQKGRVSSPPDREGDGHPGR